MWAAIAEIIGGLTSVVGSIIIALQQTGLRKVAKTKVALLASSEQRAIEDKIIAEEGWDKIAGVPWRELCHATSLAEIDKVYRRALGMEPLEPEPVQIQLAVSDGRGRKTHVVVDAPVVRSETIGDYGWEDNSHRFAVHKCRHCGEMLLRGDQFQTLECASCLTARSHIVAEQRDDVASQIELWDSTRSASRKHIAAVAAYHEAQVKAAFSVPHPIMRVHDPETHELLGGVRWTGDDWGLLNVRDL